MHTIRMVGCWRTELYNLQYLGLYIYCDNCRFCENLNNADSYHKHGVVDLHSFGSGIFVWPDPDL
jgi:hypothetical protein